MRGLRLSGNLSIEIDITLEIVSAALMRATGGQKNHQEKTHKPDVLRINIGMIALPLKLNTRQFIRLQQSQILDHFDL